MTATFEASGIALLYPENWRLDREDAPNGWTISIQSPGTAFIMVSLREDRPTREEILDTALAALREDYPDLEVDDFRNGLAGMPAVGHDIRFFSLDLTISCWTRSFHAAHGTVLLLWQCSDLELANYEPVLRAIGASIRMTQTRTP